MGETFTLTQSAHQIPRSRKIFLLLLLSSIQFLFIVDYLLVMSLGDEITTDLQITTSQLSYIISGYTFVAAIAGFSSTFYIDRFERKFTLIVSLLGFSGGSFLCFITSNIYVLILSRVIVGVFVSILTVLVMAIVGQMISKAKLGRATGTIISANAVASIIGVPAGIFIAGYFTWKTPFLLLMIFSATIAFLIYLFMPAMPPSGSMKEKFHFIAVLRKLFGVKFRWPVVFMSVMTLSGGFTILPFISLYFRNNHAFDKPDIALIFFLGGVGSFLVGPLMGFLTDKFGKQNVFLLVNFLSIIPILLVTIYPFEDDNKLFILVATSLFFMFSTGRFITGMSLVNTVFPEEYRGRFLSVTSSIRLMAGTFGTFVAGYIVYLSGGELLNFDIIGVVAVCATIICIFAAFVLEEE